MAEHIIVITPDQMCMWLSEIFKERVTSISFADEDGCYYIRVERGND